MLDLVAKVGIYKRLLEGRGCWFLLLTHVDRVIQ